MPQFRDDKGERAILARQAGQEGATGSNGLKTSIQYFVGSQEWLEFYAIGDYWELGKQYENFQEFCEKWLQVPTFRIALMFQDCQEEVWPILDAQMAEFDGGMTCAQLILNNQVKVAERQTDPDSPEHISQGKRTDQLTDNISKCRNHDHGTSKSYTLRRLARDHPELLDRVEQGELSANAAAIEAGFRQRTLTVQANPSSMAAAILKHFDADEVVAIKSQL